MITLFYFLHSLKVILYVFGGMLFLHVLICVVQTRNNLFDFRGLQTTIGLAGIEAINTVIAPLKGKGRFDVKKLCKKKPQRLYTEPFGTLVEDGSIYPVFLMTEEVMDFLSEIRTGGITVEYNPALQKQLPHEISVELCAECSEKLRAFFQEE